MKPITRKMSVAGVCVAAVLLAVPDTAGAAEGPTRSESTRTESTRSEPGWRLTPTGTEARLRGLAAVSRKIAWAAGSGGTVLRTTDAGHTWQQVGPADAAGLEVRDIEA